MNILEQIINYLNFQMETPNDYGWFHILSLIIMILIIIVLSIKKPNIKKVLFVCSLIMIVFEIYKQFAFSFDSTSITWRYQWYIFPFQFCSTPMYVAFIASIIKNKKIENALLCFLATYGLVGGISVMLYPNTVFVSETLINVQTMTHHGLMVIMGSYVIISKSIDFNVKTIISALKVFSILIFLAVLINIVTYYIGIDEGLEMFFISPFHTSTLPVFSIIYEKTPYIIFLIFYILIFTIGSSIPLFISKVFKKR